ncbi:MAG: PDZ domain-containing protein [Planctomycetes bacterium]|nr:PDZ domain-containing protein [Planctomycetota bacterium]
MFRSDLPTQADPLQDMDLSRARLALPQDEVQRQALPLGVFTGVQVGDARVTLESQLETPEGVLVTGIIDNSPAVAAGLQEGDILLEAALNEDLPMPLQWPSDWYRLEQTASSESSMHVLFDRAGRDGETTLWPVKRLKPPRRLTGNHIREETKVGLVVRNASEVEAHKAGLIRGEGCVVVGLARTSPWRKAGVVFGDLIVEINDKPIKNPQALLAAIHALDKGDAVKIGLFRDNKTLTLNTSVSQRDRETVEFKIPLIFSYENKRGIKKTSVLCGLYGARKTAVASRTTLFWVINYTTGDSNRLEETK